MLIVFRSKAAAEIYMYAEHAKALLDIIGKPFEPPQAPRGIITAEQAPEALARLRQAVEASKARQKDETGADDAAAVSVSLAQRAFPLIDMLERAQKTRHEVTWGT